MRSDPISLRLLIAAVRYHRLDVPMWRSEPPRCLPVIFDRRTREPMFFGHRHEPYDARVTTGLEVIDVTCEHYILPDGKHEFHWHYRGMDLCHAFNEEET